MGVVLSLQSLENTAIEQCHKHRGPSSGLRITQFPQDQPPGLTALLTKKGKTTKSQRSPVLGSLLLVHGCPLPLVTNMEPYCLAWPPQQHGLVLFSYPFFLRLLNREEACCKRQIEAGERRNSYAIPSPLASRSQRPAVCRRSPLCTLSTVCPKPSPVPMPRTRLHFLCYDHQSKNSKIKNKTKQKILKFVL